MRASDPALHGHDAPPPVPGQRAVIRARGLVKRYGDRIAVDGVDFDVLQGECLGFLGPNGAGKSTIMRMLYGFTPRSEGELTVLGLDVDRHPRRIKARLGVVPQDNNLDPDNTVWENLRTYARYFGIDAPEAARRASEVLDLFALADRRDAAIADLSGGMKRRLVMARALLARPDVVLLDEPTTGLDPQARRVVWRTLRQLRSAGATLVLTTHYLDEAERLCDRLVLVDHGRIVLSGRPLELMREHAGDLVLEVDLADRGAIDLAPDPDALPQEMIDAITGEGLAHVFEDGVLTVYGAGVERAELEARFDRIATPPDAPRSVRRGTLEDVFLRVTGHALVEADG